MSDPGAGLSILHVIVRAGATNSQYNEHCLPVLDERRIAVCSLFPAGVTPPPSLTLFEGDGSTPGCVRALRRALGSGPYDVVHVHAPASGVLTLAVYLLTGRSRRGLVFTVHNSWRNFRPRNRLFLRLILALFPVVVVCGRAAHDSIPDNLRRRYAHKLEVVPNGVDIDRIDSALEDRDDGSTGSPDAEAPDQDAGITVASVTRLIPVKDPATLLEAFARVRRPSDRLVLVGDGPLREQLETTVRGLDLQSSVTFTGVVERDEVYRILNRADVFVTTSAGEGLPVALLEAMGCGCPVVVSDIPPHREIAKRTTDVPLVRVGDTTGFARSLRKVFALEEADRRELGRRLRDCVAEEFSVRAMNDAYGEVYMRTNDHGGSDRLQPRRHPAGPGDDKGGTAMLTKLRLRLGLALALTALGALSGFMFAQMQTPQYKGETSLLVGSGIGGAADQDALRVSAALATTYADLVRREPVLGPVANEGFADDWRELHEDVQTQTGESNPQLVQISVYASTRSGAKRLAAAVAEQLVLVTSKGASAPQQEFLRSQLRRLESEITNTGEALGGVQERLAALSPTADATALERQAQQLRSTLAELQRNYTEMRQLGNSDVASVTRIDTAWVSRSPLRPTPIVLTVAGAATGLILALGWIHLFSRSGSPRGPGNAPTRRTGPARSRESESNGGARPMRPEPWAKPEPFRDFTSTSTKGKRR